MQPLKTRIKRRKLTLKNGLHVSVVLLRSGKLERLHRVYRRYLKKYRAEWTMEPKGYGEFYAVTFHFKRPLHVFVHKSFIKTVLKTLASTTPQNALDNCMCIFISSQLAYSTIPEPDDQGNEIIFIADVNTPLNPTVRVLKKAIENNINPSVATLIYLEKLKR
jgi:hypothetical protein